MYLQQQKMNATASVTSMLAISREAPDWPTRARPLR